MPPEPLADAALTALRNAVDGRPEVAASYLYGSVARGQSTPISDADVGLLFSPHFSDPGERRLLASEVAASIVRDLRTYDLGDRGVEVHDIDGLPLLLRGEIVTQGLRASSADDVTRVRFETETRQRYFDFLPFREASVSPALRAMRERLSDG